MNPRASAWRVYQLISSALMLCLITAAVFADAASIIDQKYYSLGGARGFPGSPTFPEAPGTDSVGQYNRYNKGSIYRAPRTGGQEVEAKSPIHDKWKSLGGARGFLGSPISPERTATDGVGRYRRYQGGSIYWSPQTGAHEVHGAILDKWVSIGSESGYGYPITDEVVAPDGRGRYNHFEGARSIYWTPETGAHAIFGAIRGKWADLGLGNGRLGYPTTDELGTADGFWRFNHFERGSIFWSIETGAVDYASGKPGNPLGRNPRWGLLANPGFEGRPMKSAFFFAGDWKFSGFIDPRCNSLPGFSKFYEYCTGPK